MLDISQPDAAPRSGAVDAIWKLEVLYPKKFDQLPISKLNQFNDEVLDGMLNTMQKTLNLSP